MVFRRTIEKLKHLVQFTKDILILVGALIVYDTCRFFAFLKNLILNFFRKLCAAGASLLNNFLFAIKTKKQILKLFLKKYFTGIGVHHLYRILRQITAKFSGYRTPCSKLHLSFFHLNKLNMSGFILLQLVWAETLAFIKSGWLLGRRVLVNFSRIFYRVIEILSEGIIFPINFFVKKAKRLIVNLYFARLEMSLKLRQFAKQNASLQLLNRFIHEIKIWEFIKTSFSNIRMSEETSAMVFRLAAVLCIFFIIIPEFNFKNRDEPLDEYGIGGGILVNAAYSVPEDNNFLIESDFSTQQTSEIATSEIYTGEAELFPHHHSLLYDSHVVKSGENISELAVGYGLNTGTLFSVNKIPNARTLQIDQVLKIPNQDGILHSVKTEDTLASISKKYDVDAKTIQYANELFSENVKAGTDLFIPGAKLDDDEILKISGDLFIWPIYGVITSSYGYRRDPFNMGQTQFHSGIDIAGRLGAPVRAAMSGRVSRTGYDGVLGNYIIINHHSEYRTLYGHLSYIRTRAGAVVVTGERIGDVGSTGVSTGPHLHFVVYKNNYTVNPRFLMR